MDMNSHVYRTVAFGSGFGKEFAEAAGHVELCAGEWLVLSTKLARIWLEF